MARRQTEISGFGRKEVPEVEAAGEAYREIRDERRALKDTEKQKKFELIAVMKAYKVKVYKWKDPDSGDELRVEITEGETKVKLAKTGEADSEIGEGIASNGHSRSNEPGIHAGLIAEAEKADTAANVEVTGDGDVVVPDKAAPKAKKKRAPKAKN